MFHTNENLPVSHDLTGGKLRTKDVLLEDKVTFSSLLLKEEIQSGLTRCGYTHLSPIQRNALPVALTGTSIIAHAKSGTGKTLVYVLSALNSVLEKKPSNLQCLILAPTREIAKQIYDVFKNVGYYIKNLNVEYFIGGTPLDLDVLKCNQCHIAVGAPGRIKHLIELNELKTESVKMLVLDEVDALLCNKEFAIKELASYLPTEKQTIVCTATFSDSIKKLLEPISSTAQYITVAEKTDDSNSEQVASNVLIGIKQYVAPVFCDSTSLDTMRKRNKLIEILRNFKYDQCFIFVNYVTIAKGLCNMLINNDFPALWVSSEQNQSTRISTLNKLKLNQCNILVTTDLAARGIDVHNVNLVVNMGIPSPPDVYIHRMGRAGRYGSEGAVITILHEGQEMDEFRKLVSAVSTDPVVLHILPKEITKNITDSDLQLIDCLPNSDMSTNISEYHFKKNNENQTTTKKKSKKSKKKKKPKIDLLETETATNATNHITEETTGNVDKEMEKMVEEYIMAIKSEMDRENIAIDKTSLENLFKPKNSNFCAVQFSDYFKPTFIDVRKDEDDDDDVFIQTNDNDSLKKFIRFIKKKHEFLDEQKLPCSVSQFLELIRNNDNLMNHISVNIRDSIKDVLQKMGTLSKQDSSQSNACPGNKSVHIELGTVEKNPLKRINAHLISEEPTSIDTIGSIERETCNWMVSHTEYLSSKYSPKRSKNQDLRPLVHFTANPPTNISYCANNRNNFIGNISQPASANYPSFQIPTTSQSNIPIPSFNVPEAHTPLPPISTYVDSDMEQRIWRSHFNFINNHIRSLPFMFGNR